MHIGLPMLGGIWIERASARDAAGWRPEMKRDGGEVLVWWRTVHLIITPPGWRPVPAPRTATEGLLAAE